MSGYILALIFEDVIYIKFSLVHNGDHVHVPNLFLVYITNRYPVEPDFGHRHLRSVE